MPTLDVAIDVMKAKYGADQFDSAIRKMQRGAESLDKGLSKTDAGFLGLGKTVDGLAKRLTGLAAVYSIERFVKSSVQEMMKFETGLARVSLMLDEQSMRYLPKYRDELQNMSKQYGADTEVLSKGLHDVLQAGIGASKALDVLNTAEMMATAEMSDTSTAVDVLTTVMNSYGMSANQALKVSDILFATMNNGRVTLNDLAASLGQVTSLAAMLGVPIEEVGAAIATMTRSGVSAQNAMMTLKGIFTTLLSPTEEETKAAQKYGLELNTNTLRTTGLTGVIKLLQNASGDQLAQIFSNTRGLNGLATMTKHADDLTAAFAHTTDSAGETLKAFNVIAGTTAFQLSKMGQEWKNLKLIVGEKIEPAISPTFKALGESIPWTVDQFYRVAGASAAVSAKVDKIAASLLSLMPGAGGAAEKFRLLGEAYSGLSDDIAKTMARPKIFGPMIDDATRATRRLRSEQNDLMLSMIAMGGTWEDWKKIVSEPVLIKSVMLSDKEIAASKEARKEANQLVEELKNERGILFLTDDERERSIKLTQLEAVVKKDLTGESAKLVEEYKNELEKLQDAKELKRLVATVTDSVGALVETPLAAILDSTKSFGGRIKDELRSLTASILTMMYEQMITNPVKKWATNLLMGGAGGGAGGLASLIDLFAGGGGGNTFANQMAVFGAPAEKGIVMNKSGLLEHFDLGGVVNRPTVFPMANGMGLMAEKESEAVMPLSRDKSGRLGVRMEGSQSESSLKIVNVLDKSVFEDYLSSGAGERVIINIIRRNPDQIGG